jgi:peptidoglycan/xylan/chitin deacetylase (PgdA/CDA1 family)
VFPGRLAGALKVLCACAAVVLAPVAMATPRVMITVDVESLDSYPLPDQIDAVCQDGSACGLMEIARLQKERGLSGTFFLNVYEHRAWGEAKMREIVRKLQAAGQDLGLHTHPQWAYDPKRNGMHQYNLEEQTSIIQDGVRLLSDWSGHPVVAHRAGDYAANELTLKALEASGLRVDSSLFWGHPHSQLTQLGLPRNLPSSWGKMLEIPVTVYERRERPRLLSGIAPPLSSIRKIDVNWFTDEKEAKAAIDAIVEADPPFLVVFLHSFTLLGERANDGVPAANRQARAVFSAILDRIADKHLPVVTMGDLAGGKVIFTHRSPDLVPFVDVEVSLPHYLWHAWRARKASVLAATGAALASFLVLAGLAFAQIRKTVAPI